MSFSNWRKRLEAAKLPTVAARRAAVAALKINFSQPGLEDEGYYRRPITEAANGADGKTNGQRRVVGWEPVAYFIENGKLWGVIGDRDMAINEVADEGLWSWVVSNPISEELYRAVERGEPWPDLPKAGTVPVCERCNGDRYINIHENMPDEPCPKCNAGAPSGAERVRAAAAGIPAVNREVSRSDNAPPEEAIPLDVQHATAIDAAISAALTKVASEIEAAQALGSKNRLAELRLAADKAGKALYEPLYREYQAVQKPWPPMIARAAAEEKRLNTAILTFRESERKRIAAEQLAATIENERIAALNERVADRAIEAGATEAPEFVAEVMVPMAPAPVQATYRAPGQRAALKEVESWHLDEITDYDAVYAYFKDTEAVKVLLKVLATAAVKAERTVPGTKTHKGLV